MLETCVDLACDAEMIAVARQFVRRTLLLWEVDPEHTEEAVLLTSELMSNAVLHARTDVRLNVRANDDGTLRIDVSDENPRMPHTSTPPEEAQSGRGLWLVETLASSWGIDRTQEGKSVWFELGKFRPDPEDEACIDVTAESVDDALDRIEQLGDARAEGAPAEDAGGAR